MTNEQLNKYYEVDRKYNGCILINSQCPLKDHCNGLVRTKCKEYTPSEHQWVTDEIIKGYHEMEEVDFVRKCINGHIL